MIFLLPIWIFFWIFGGVYGFMLSFFLDFFLDFFNKKKIRFLQIFWDFFIFFFRFLWILFKATMVTTKSYQGYYWTRKMSRNSIISPFFARRAKQASGEGRSRPQELEEGPCSRTYLFFYPCTGNYFKYICEALNSTLLGQSRSQ